MRKIRVLHLELSSSIGGIESFLLNLYREMDRNLIQFDFVTQSEKPALQQEFLDLGANIYRVSSIKKLGDYQKDIRKIVASGYDVVHVHKNSLANIIPLFCGKKENIPVFLHSHNTKPSAGKFTYILHEINRDKAYKMTREHFACSTDAGKWMYGDKSFTLAKNGILVERFKFDEQKRRLARKKLEIQENAFVVGNIGRFTDQKNHSKLLDIFEKILKLNETSYLLLVGEGENKEKIKLKAEKLGITNKVKFLGNRNDIPELLMCMDAFVMPSLYEGLPIAAVEAQASGVRTFLSDTISKETELGSAVNWFSVEEPEKTIAEEIVRECQKEFDRIYCNSEIVEAGFSMKTTAKMLMETYRRYVK